MADTLDARHWRSRANATRAQADRNRIDDRQKEKLLRVAEEYEKLAERAERSLGLNIIPFVRKVRHR